MDRLWVKVTVEYDYRMSEVWRQQTQEAIQQAVLPLEQDEAFRIVLKVSTNQ